jgi:hypothetical protein
MEGLNEESTSLGKKYFPYSFRHVSADLSYLNAGYVTQFHLIPELGFAILLMANGSVPWDVRDTIRLSLDKLLHIPQPALVDSERDSTAQLARYAGTYRSEKGDIATVTFAGDVLHATYSSVKGCDLDELSVGIFTCSGSIEQFSINGQGTPEYLNSWWMGRIYHREDADAGVPDAGSGDASAD